MPSVKAPPELTERIQQRAQLIFHDQQQAVYIDTDRWFCALMICQWLAGILVALWISPRTWAGRYSDVHIHIWMAVFLGGIIIALPIYLALTQPGKASTRYTIATGQMLYSALLIHLTGGRIETHFHVFGSLAFLSFYRDWRVLIPASIVVAADHFLRGVYFPQSVYGVAYVEPWRWLEHTWWVVFEDVFLIGACIRNMREMYVTAYRQAEVEETNASIEMVVNQRTEELDRARVRLSLQYGVVKVLAEATTWQQAVLRILESIAESIAGENGRVWGAFWSGDNSGTLKCATCLQIPNHSLDEFEQMSKNTHLPLGGGLPGLVWELGKVACIPNISENLYLPRLAMAEQCRFSAAVAFPITHQGKILGVFEFFTEKYPDLDSEVFEALGRLIGQFRLRKEAEAEATNLANVVQTSGDAIFTISLDNTITSWNTGASRLLGYTADEIRGQNVSMLIPPGKEDQVATLQSMISNGERVDDYETQSLTKEGKQVEVLLSRMPLANEAGNRSGCSITLHDITQRKEAEKRVSEFYSMVSHELRTPLTSIRGSLGLIEGGIVESGSREAMEMVEAARGSADRLIRLINDILDLKKIESGKFQLKKSSVDAKELVSCSLYALMGMAEEAGIKLRDDTAIGGNVYADWDKSTQIITNLVSNAIKFSPKGSQVSVITEVAEHNRIRFRIIDSGVGIATNNIPKLFDKFQQIDSSNSRLKGGTGLGLAISKALVEEHGGTIGVSSCIGKGSEFWFELPVYIENETSTADKSDQPGSIDNGFEGVSARQAGKPAVSLKKD